MDRDNRPEIPSDTRGKAFAVKAALLLIILAFAGALAVGVITNEPMIGDEVTHYYMLVTQSKVLPEPNVTADIPMAGGKVDQRYYPHVFLWHYLGAVIYRLSGNSFGAVQFYHSLFWLQFLVVGWLLARANKGADPSSGVVYVLSLASLPMAILLAVAFYQDIPATAQLMTAFLLLRKRKVEWSAVFIGVALAMKITSFVMLPAYLACVVIFQFGRERRWMALLRTAIAVLIVAGMCAAMSTALKRIGWQYYPATILRHYAERLHINLPISSGGEAVSDDKTRQILSPPVDLAPHRPEVANNPGDLRRPANFLIYGGGIIYALAFAAIPAAIFLRRRRMGREVAEPRDMWALWVGLWLLIVTAYHMREAPDIRFFLPGVVLILLPLSQLVAELPWRRIWLPALLAVSLIQGGTVLKKVHDLRHVPAGVRAAIEFYEQHPEIFTHDRVIFMYPEGNYRLFPFEVNWYLDYRLREFWQADPDRRTEMLREAGIGSIVIKKYLVGELDREMNNLGVYPDFFVRDVEKDDRFTLVMDNDDVAIYVLNDG